MATPDAINPLSIAPGPEARRDSTVVGKSLSKTVTDTITGEHEHTIVGYSLVKGIGDGEPIASERFSVGGHEWVLLFYPDGKRSSSGEAALPPTGLLGGPMPAPQPPQAPQHHPHPHPAAPAPPHGPMQPLPPGAAGQPRPPMQPPPNPQAVMGYPPAVPQLQLPGQHAPQPQGAHAQHPGGIPPPNPIHMNPQHPAQQQQQQHLQLQRREGTNDYAALFVALIGENDNPQGVVSTSDGRVVRAFHRFTLVDQSSRGRESRDLTKGRRRDQGAVKISCARQGIQDPNARNCHGYRKFVKRTVLENPAHGYLVNDTIVIRYTIELVISSGGALSRNPAAAPIPRPPAIQVPASTLGTDLSSLLETGENADVTFTVEDETLRAHKIILTARSAVFNALLKAPMREGTEGIVKLQDIRAPVFRALLHFVYTDSLPAELEGANLDVAMAQHLLVGADRFALARLRRICEGRLCDTVEVESVATTLALAEQNHAEELKRVCLEYVSKHLSLVIASEGYQHMVNSCPQLQNELLQTIAVSANERSHRARHGSHPRDHTEAAIDEARRVRPRRE